MKSINSKLGSLMQALERRRRQWRRARNLRTGATPWGPTHWIATAGFGVAVAGALLIAGHARYVGAAAAPALAGAVLPADALRNALPGLAFEVGHKAGISLAGGERGTLLIASGMLAAPPVRLDLCRQLLDPSRPRLLPLRIGYRFDDVAKLVERAGDTPLTLRNIALAGPEGRDMPRLEISGDIGQPLRVQWQGRLTATQWIGDSGRIARGATGFGTLAQEGWLTWRPDTALRLQRRPSAACPQAGELLVQRYQVNPDHTSAALVAAFPLHGAVVSSALPPGRYLVPTAPPPALEDQSLFEALQRRGLLRLGADGLIATAPRDLAAWQGANDSMRAGDLAQWRGVVMDDEARQLLKRLHRMADGVYVREQISVFNSERMLLAWRQRPGPLAADWQASIAGAPAAIADALPASASRLLAAVPQGWGAWRRIAAWPQGDAPVRLILALPRAARDGETVSLMVAGRFQAVQGARLAAPPQAICDGRACPSKDGVQLISLALSPGVHTVMLDVAPIAMSALAVAADQRYRHIQLSGDKLAWQPLATRQQGPRAAPPAGVTLADRNGTLLWSAGEPTEVATRAGLGTMLGVRADHAGSIAGMLARLPSDTPHAARLTLDLPLQQASAAALDCIGMRRGHWNGAQCSGGQAAPAGRQAGIVVIDTETGDILAAASAGAARVDAANWDEVQNFDRTDPARSPLRLAAFQHDGGAHRSPGSTFKIISALGLELAAKTDPQIDALLGGVPLPALNRLAHQKGFAFRTDSASYPADTRLAHITNYRDQFLDRRAQDGRLGLSQALTYSLNTWFAWSSELSDRSLFGRAEGGAPDLQALDPDALDEVRPIVAMAHRLGFEQAFRLDGGLLPPDFAWGAWDALQASAAHIDPVHTRHELRQMAIGLRMQATPLQMAMAAGAIGQGRVVAPRLLLELDTRQATAGAATPLGVRLDRIRTGLKGVVDSGTAAGAFRDPRLAPIRAGLFGKTGTAPTGADGVLATVWFTGYLQPGSLPGQTHRLAVAAFVSHSDASGGEHAAPIVAAVLAARLQHPEQRGK